MSLYKENAFCAQIIAYSVVMEPARLVLMALELTIMEQTKQLANFVEEAVRNALGFQVKFSAQIAFKPFTWAIINAFLVPISAYNVNQLAVKFALKGFI